MALGDLTSRDAVLKALAEHDRLGEDAFLKKYGFGPARRYFLVHNDKRYASKAVVAAAYGFQNGTPLRAYDFSGGDATVGTKLEQLGFKVEGPNSAFDESIEITPQTQFWWVSQNKTFNEEREGGYLWAPLRDKGGNVPHHWETMAQVKAGDVVFSYAGQSIKAISIAKGPAFPCTRPKEFADAEAWMNDGRRIDVHYKDFDSPLHRHDFVDELLPLLPDLYSPLTSQGTGNQGYLFALPPKAGRWLLNRTHTAHLLDDQELVAFVPESRETQKEAIIQSRIGQGQFRDAVLSRWKGKCCVTGLPHKSLLRASHIKPWRESSNLERLDPENGLLLSPAYDAAFDAGYITFQPTDGQLVVSQKLGKDGATRLGLTVNARVEGLSQKNKAYLEYHRANIFLG